jgi:hypothetical protein
MSLYLLSVEKRKFFLYFSFFYINKLGSYWCRKVTELVPRIDCLINNAGVFMTEFQAVFRIRIRIYQIHMFMGHPDLFARGMDPAPDPDPSIIKQKY